MSKGFTTQKPIIVTGSAGFIGYHLCKDLLDKGYQVLGIDNVNAYYDTSLKINRLKQLEEYKSFRFEHVDISDLTEILKIFSETKPDYVVHLAAQAGVRYCIDNPHAYTTSNLVGHMSILEAVRAVQPKHVIYASSSSVYGNSDKTPFKINDFTDSPVSLYAATKKSCEVMSHSYAHMYKLPMTGLRFFTVYGPWGRPDMAYFKFTKSILNNQPIDVYNNGNMLRDFTYIDDIIAGITACIPLAPNSFLETPHRLLNIGHNHPEKLDDLISFLEEIIGKKAIKNFLPMQTGDVYATYADIDDLVLLTGVKPSTTLRNGLENFIIWFKNYYQIQ